jgi:hypothetical protein
MIYRLLTGSSSFFVGVVGFEPTTPWSQTRCANRTALYPENDSLFILSAERGGFEPPVQNDPYVGLANRWFQPLTHLSLVL